MNSLYVATAIDGKVIKYQRASKVIFSNPINDVGTVAFFEETAIILPDGTSYAQFDRTAGPLCSTLSDQTTTFPLLDPSNGDVVGTSTYKDVYAMIYSMYIDLGKKRDAEGTIAAEGTN